MKDRSLEEVAQQAESLCALFADEHRWNKYKRAVDEDGEIVDPLSAHAVKFCLVGGIIHVTGNDCAEDEPLSLLIANSMVDFDSDVNYSRVLKPNELTDEDLWTFNDRREHHEVMEVLRTAAAMARGAASE